MTISLTNQGIVPQAGQAAYLPNQPILQNCVVATSQETPLVAGAIVSITTDDTLGNVTPVKQAAVTDTPLGVVVLADIQTSYAAKSRVSVFPVDSYVWMPAAGAITAGANVQFNAENQVAATSTASNGYIGIAITAATVENDMVVVQIKPGLEPAAVPGG